MALAVPQKPYNVIGDNYKIALNQSIQSLLASLNKPSSDFSLSSSSFLDLMMARADPPLESIWFYSASTFRSIVAHKDEILDRFAITKDLFQSITARSSSSRSSKSIVLIAPVIYQIHKIYVDLKLKVNELGFKTEKKLFREIKSLIDVILGYINVCCVSNEVDEVEDLISLLDDLVRVWIDESIAEKEDEKVNLKRFFPLLSNETVELLSVNELAAAVMVEAFLLKLCFKFSEESGFELENQLRTWAVGSITGFRNSLFFETLLKQLLEPTLPVTSLLNNEDEILLRKILYDSVILPEYSFLNPERAAQLPINHVKILILVKLMVTHQAIELVRGNGDQTKAISYSCAFSNSHLPSQIIKLVTDEIGVDGKSNGPKGSSPKAFLNWLLNLENHGIRVFGEGMSKYHSKLALDDIKTDKHLEYNVDKSASDTYIFFLDNKGSKQEEEEEEEEEEDNDDDNVKESISAAFMAAAHTMQSPETEGGKKRKKGRDSEKKKKVKFVKYDLDVDSGLEEEKSMFNDKDCSSGDSHVENPISEDDL